MHWSALTGILLIAASAHAQESQNETLLLSNESGIDVGGAIDLIGEYVATDAPDQDGFDFTARTLELSAGGSLFEGAQFYATGVFEYDDLALTEGAVVLTGLGGNGSLSLGRTALDFGKQMQLHRHELRTVERPLVLRTFLGNSSWGDGARYDNWFASGDHSAVRFSLGVFGQIGAAGEETSDPTLEPFEEDRREPDSIGLTARLTGYADLTPTSQFQIGASYRLVPDFSYDYDPSGASVDGLNVGLLGLDATFAWTDVSGVQQWTLGGELLWLAGDTGTVHDDSGTPLDFTDDNFTVLEEDSVGFYLYGDYGWDALNSAGLQYSWIELPESGGPEAGEIDLYYTRFLDLLTSEDRLRFGVTLAHQDSLDESVRFVIQFTTGIGSHPNQANW